MLLSNSKEEEPIIECKINRKIIKAIMKCDQKGEDKILLGNNFADRTAKAAAKRETEPGKGMLVLTRAQIAKKTECIQIRGQHFWKINHTCKGLYSSR